LKGSAGPVLIELLGTDGTENRRGLVHALDLLGSGDERELATLVALLTDQDPGVRQAVPGGLAQFGDRAVPHLEKLLARDGERRGEQPFVTAITQSLLRIGTKLALRVLKKIAEDGRYGRMPRDLLDAHLASLRKQGAHTTPGQQAKKPQKPAKAAAASSKTKRAPKKPRKRA
jgi:hypothetical protein